MSESDIIPDMECPIPECSDSVGSSQPFSSW